MENLKSKLKNYEIPKPKKKFNFRYQVLADEMTINFKRNCYWLFWKYPEHKIENAYKVCKEKGIDKISYLIGMLNKN
jgi:hypothetical protein